MARGKKANVGDERVAPNGYAYIRTETGWRLKHHVIAEEQLGRPLRVDERVVFHDGDRKNLKPSNIRVMLKGKASLRRRKAQLEARIEELKAELDDINQQINTP